MYKLPDHLIIFARWRQQHKNGQVTLNFATHSSYCFSVSLFVNIANESAILTDLSPRPSVCLCVCLSVRKMYCGKTADWIRMRFGVVNGVGQGMGVLDGNDVPRRRRGSFGMNLGRPIETNRDFVAWLCVSLSSCRLGWWWDRWTVQGWAYEVAVHVLREEGQHSGFCVSIGLN